MSVSARVKGAGSVVLGLAVLVGMTAIGVGLLVGAAAFSLWVLKWTFPVFSIALLASLVILGPLAIIPAARGFSAVGFMVASFVFGIVLWLWAVAYTFSVWGLVAVIIGLMLLGGGVVPVAMVAALFHGDWGNLGLFIVTTLIVVGCRVLAEWLAEKVDGRSARLSPSEITAEAYEVRE